MGDGKGGMGNALRAKLEQYERQLKELQEAYGEGVLQIRARKSWLPAGQGLKLMLWVQQGLKEEGVCVPMAWLCQ